MKSHKEWPWQQLSTVPQSTPGLPSVEFQQPSYLSRVTYGILDRRNLYSAWSTLTSMTYGLPLASSYFQGCFRVALTRNDSYHLLCSTEPLPHKSMCSSYSKHSSIHHLHAPSSISQIRNALKCLPLIWSLTSSHGWVIEEGRRACK